MKHLNNLTEDEIKELLPAIGDRLRFADGMEVKLLQFEKPFLLKITSHSNLKKMRKKINRKKKEFVVTALKLV